MAGICRNDYRDKGDVMNEKLTPTTAARAYCSECMGMNHYDREQVRGCEGDTAKSGACPLFRYRLNSRVHVQVFRAVCLHCVGGHIQMVDVCETRTCHVWKYRLGKNPELAGKRKGSKAGIEALKEYREKAVDDRFLTLESTNGCQDDTNPMQELSTGF